VLMAYDYVWRVNIPLTLSMEDIKNAIANDTSWEVMHICRCMIIEGIIAGG